MIKESIRLWLSTSRSLGFRQEGLGKAYVHGFQWALARAYQNIFEMDADLSHPAKSLPQMIDALENEVDVIVGSRYLSGVNVVNWPIMRILLSMGASFDTPLIFLSNLCN